jgi:hypothetical protein
MPRARRWPASRRQLLVNAAIAASRAARHSITFSARASRVGGTSRPSARALLRLITNSNFVGCSTGRSAGFVPLRRYSPKAGGGNKAVHGPLAVLTTVNV